MPNPVAKVPLLVARSGRLVAKLVTEYGTYFFAKFIPFE